MTRRTISNGRLAAQTRNNWLIDAAVFMGVLVAAITGIYFLFLPSGGYQGGRNPLYGVTILFSRNTWDDLHTWFGVLMIAAVAVHFTIHWNWVQGMTKHIAKSVAGEFKISQMTSDRASITLRGADGRPGWAGRGRQG